MGEIIVIEGACDGVGKTTQSERLEQRLVNNGDKIITHHFHSREQDEGKLAENLLKGLYGDKSQYSAEWIHNLFAVDRQIVWATQLKKEYEAGKTLLLDRYITSTMIYQGAMKGDQEQLRKFIDYVTHQEYDIYQIQKPDTVIFLYADFDFAMEQKRLKALKDHTEKDLFEKDLDYMRKVYDTAMYVADYQGWDKIKCDEGDHMRSIEDIHEDVYRIVMKRREERKRND